MKTLPLRSNMMTGLVAVVAVAIVTFFNLSGDARASEAPFTPATSPSIAPASAPVVVASEAPEPLTPDVPVVVAAPPAPAAAPAAPAAKPAAKPATTTKKTTTTVKKPAAPAPKVNPAAPKPGTINVGVEDPSKVGQYCVVIGGVKYGKLC